MRSKISRGYTIIELLIVMAIIGILLGIVTPQYDLLLVRANQAKAKAELASLRSAMNIYYSTNEGLWPFEGYPNGTGHQADTSLTDILVPTYFSNLSAPYLKDRNPSFNGFLNTSYDLKAEQLLSLDPPHDVFLFAGPPMINFGQDEPYALDTAEGWVYINNGNYDAGGNSFIDW